MKFVAMTVSSLAFASAVYAQTAVEDTNADGVYSMEELLVAFPSLTDEIFAEIDVNDDGAVDAEELAAAEAVGLVTSG
ncbi:MAG: EF-hand domain-containing protein [Boseongicola sp.]|nr:EF-hand domain-containing protein [Boseongicola sp.]MDD9977746.1 EF-hand domain-containing protein [Boseongicola sp.]